LFDDRDPDTTPIEVMHQIVRKNPRNADLIFPYIGGEEVNDSPTQSHRRFVINFGEMTEEEARCWPDLISIVEAKVRPEREQLDPDADGGRLRRNWWLWARNRPALFEAIKTKKADHVLVNSSVGTYLSFAIQPSGRVFSHALNVFVDSSFNFFMILQSRIHEIWARFMASSMKDDLRYTPSDCFETFPFPRNFDLDTELEARGREYYGCRTAIMKSRDQGLTKTYNRFHDPEELDSEILRLRELHSSMDLAVLKAYGWVDLQSHCEFLLDYEDDESTEEVATRKRRKPWRLRWPDETRDEVLARLLELNRQLALEEGIAGNADVSAMGAGRSRGQVTKPKIRNATPLVPGLLGEEKQ